MISDPFPDDGIELFPLFPSYVIEDWRNNRLKCDRPCCREMYWGNISTTEKDESARSDAQSTASKSSRSSHESGGGKPTGASHGFRERHHRFGPKRPDVSASLPDAAGSIPSEIKDQFEKIPFQWREELVDLSRQMELHKAQARR